MNILQKKIQTRKKTKIKEKPLSSSPAFGTTETVRDVSLDASTISKEKTDNKKYHSMKNMPISIQENKNKKKNKEKQKSHKPDFGFNSEIFSSSFASSF